jgi:hypothetical protein
MIRPDAFTHIVLTEDGNSPMTADTVIQHFEGNATATCDAGGFGLGLGCPNSPMWSPGVAPGRWAMHGVLCLGTSGGTGGLCGFTQGGPQNTMDIIAATDGLSSDLGNAGGSPDPFAELLEKLAEQVIINAISCDYAIPASDEPFSKDKVNVFYTDANGAALQFGKAIGAAGCGNAIGWHYDNETADKPGKVLLCPAACELVQKDANARVDVEFGCETVNVDII